MNLDSPDEARELTVEGSLTPVVYFQNNPASYSQLGRKILWFVKFLKWNDLHLAQNDELSSKQRSTLRKICTKQSLKTWGFL